MKTKYNTFRIQGVEIVDIQSPILNPPEEKPLEKTILPAPKKQTTTTHKNPENAHLTPKIAEKPQKTKIKTLKKTINQTKRTKHKPQFPKKSRYKNIITLRKK